MNFKIQLPNGKTSRPYSEEQVVSLRAKNKILAGATVVAETPIDIWIEARKESDCAPATESQLQ